MTVLTQAALDRLDTWIAGRMERDGTPGLSLAIADRDGVIHAAGFGLADVAAGTPVSPGHLFEPGSIGKSFTAVALLQLADEGKVDLQAPVTEYLPWFTIQSEFEPIRLHHLLSHTAGITAGMDFAPSGTIQVWGLRDSAATTPPGTYFHYSNVGYKVLGEVLRAVTGETYGPTIQVRILDPLGLVDSAPTITNAVRSRLAVGYGPLYDDRPWSPEQPLAPATWLETDTADGCMAMTASDLVTYLRMLLHLGEIDGKRVLLEEGFARLTQRVIPMDEPPADVWYGYGITTALVEGHTWIGHGGGMVGYFAGMRGDLETGIGVVTLVNGPGAPGWITRTVLAYVNSLLAGAPFEFPELEDAAPDAAVDAGIGDDGSAPAEWAAYPGHYRSHNPWTTSFRVVARQGRLWLTFAAEPDGLEPEQPLVALGEGWFRAGEDPRIPERVRFDTVIEGQAHRATLSGCEFYRVNTP